MKHTNTCKQFCKFQAIFEENYFSFSSRKKSKPHDVIQLSCKPRPCSVNNHYRCKKASCSNNIHSVVHSSSAPAKLDKLASQEDTKNSEKASQDKGNVTDNTCSKPDLYNRTLSVPGQSLQQSDASGNKLTMQEDFKDDDVVADQVNNEENTESSAGLVRTTYQIGEEQIDKNDLEETSNKNIDKYDLEENSTNPTTLLDNDDRQESSLEGFQDSHQHTSEKEACMKTDKHDDAVISEINAPSNQSRPVCEIDKNFEDDSRLKEPNQSEANAEKSLMTRLIEGGRKISSANNSPKATRKQNISKKSSNELPKESETSSGLTANLKKNFKSRFDSISISFRKDDDSVNTSELQWQSEDSDDISRLSGKRNILAAAQERGRAFIPELKNKFSGLSNRSPRMDRKRDWEKVIEESGCRTSIIQI